MKVFTVGLDQKPPLKDDNIMPEKSEKAGSPPPGYSTTTISTEHVPLPVGPALPMPPPGAPLAPLIVRKSRGYKGVLMVMLTVFLIALFALTLSEIAYNRQRDENFFRLRWAELKHRLGGYGAPDGAYDYYHRANLPFALGRHKELGEAISPVSSFSQQQQQQQQQQLLSSEPPTTTDGASTAAPVLAEVIDTSEARPRQLGGGNGLFPVSASASSSGSRASSASNSQSAELLPQDASGIIRDARLQFLRSILRRIKQHAEDMGFDGTMQVSVIEVEPQGGEEQLQMGGGGPSKSHFGGGAGGGGPSGLPMIQQILPGFLSHLTGGGPPAQIDEPSMLNPKSDAFLDGFGEIHQPSFLQNNRIAEENRARMAGGEWPSASGHAHSTDNNNNNNEEPPPMEFGGEMGPIQWSRVNNPFRPEGFFRPTSWQLMSQQQQQPQQQQQQQFPQQQHILPRPFEQWGGASSGNGIEDEFMPRHFGHAHQLKQQQQQQAPPPPPMIQIFPHPQPFFIPPQQAQQMFQQQQQQQPQQPQFPVGQMMGIADAQAQAQAQQILQQAQQQQQQSVFEFGNGIVQTQQPIEFPHPQPQGQQQQPQLGLPQQQPQPQPQGQQEVMGSMYGRKFGSLLQDIIANRIHGFSQLQQQQQQKQPMTFIPPEDRIQVEPPTTPPSAAQQQQQQKSVESNNNNNIGEKLPKTVILDSEDNNNNNNNNVNVGWTHQPQRPPFVGFGPGPMVLTNSGSGSGEDSLESVRNFAKMMAAGAAEAAARHAAAAAAASASSEPLRQPQQQPQQQQVDSSAADHSSSSAAASAAEPVDNSDADDDGIKRWGPKLMQHRQQQQEKQQQQQQQEKQQQQQQLPIVPLFLPIDTPVDFPTVRFPMMNAAAAAEASPASADASAAPNRADVVVDRVAAPSADSQNDQDEEFAPPPTPSQQPATAPAAAAAEGGSGAEKTPVDARPKDAQHAPPAGAHANGVFFQVDDPTASSGESRAPLVTA